MRLITDVLADTDQSDLLEGLSLPEYLDLPHASGSILNAPSMKHVRLAYEQPIEPTDRMRKGALADSLLFDYIVPAVRNGTAMQDALDRFDAATPVFGGTRSGAAWEDFREEHGERYLRRNKTLDERDDIIRMVTAIVTDPLAAPYWKEGVAQATLAVTEGGILMKGRPDWVTPTHIVDMKTTARIEPRSVSNTTFHLAYHWKMALYRRWWERCTGVRLECVLIFVEQSLPHDVVVMPLPEVVLSLAEEKALARVAELKQCIEVDHWPGVANGEPLMLEIPTWEMEEVEWQ